MKQKHFHTLTQANTSETQTSVDLIRTYSHNTEQYITGLVGISSETHIYVQYTNVVFDRISLQVQSALGAMGELYGNTLYGG